MFSGPEVWCYQGFGKNVREQSCDVDKGEMGCYKVNYGQIRILRYHFSIVQYSIFSDGVAGYSYACARGEKKIGCIDAFEPDGKPVTTCYCQGDLCNGNERHEGVNARMVFGVILVYAMNSIAREFC